MRSAGHGMCIFSLRPVLAKALASEHALQFVTQDEEIRTILNGLESETKKRTRSFRWPLLHATHYSEQA